MGSYALGEAADCAYFEVLSFHLPFFFIFAAIVGGALQTPQEALLSRRQ